MGDEAEGVKTGAVEKRAGAEGVKVDVEVLQNSVDWSKVWPPPCEPDSVTTMTWPS